MHSVAHDEQDGNGKVFRQCRVCRKLAQHKYDAKRRDYAA